MHRNGVDIAIAVLLELAKHRGHVSPADLAARLGIPGSTLHRVLSLLGAAGVIDKRRNSIAAGPVCSAFAANADIAADRPAAPALSGLAVRGWDPLDRLAAVPVSGLQQGARLPHAGRRTALRIGFSNSTCATPWRVALVHCLEHSASRMTGDIAHLHIRHADSDAGRQAADIDAMVREGVDGLLVSALPAPPVHAAIRRASGAGVAVILIDQRVPDDVPHDAFVTTSDIFIGQTMARWLAETLSGQGSIVMLPGPCESETAQRRYAAAADIFRACPGLRVEAVGWAGWQEAQSRDFVGQLIREGGTRIDGVWCGSGIQCAGSLRAFVTAGHAPGTIPPHTGGDLNGAYKLALTHGVRLAGISGSPSVGAVALEMAVALLRGHWIPRHVVMPSDVVITRGGDTRSVEADIRAEDHVRWDRPDELILSAGLPRAYDPQRFRIHYPGNRYNRSAAEVAQ